MMRTMISFLTLLVVLTTATTGNNGITCGTTNIRCVCGTGENRMFANVMGEVSATENVTTGTITCNVKVDPFEECALINCIPYESTPSFVQSSGNLTGYAASSNPEIFTVSKGEKEHRYTRATDPCHVKGLKHGNVQCWKWTGFLGPSYINCSIECVYGHGIQTSSGTVKSIQMNCRHRDNIWKPIAYPNCKPYINCRPVLIRPGKQTCFYPDTDPSYCDISCDDIGDEWKGTSLQKYECLNDAFGKSLPTCAVLNKNIELIEKPKGSDAFVIKDQSSADEVKHTDDYISPKTSR